jgi:hypothetical protein
MSAPTGGVSAPGPAQWHPESGTGPGFNIAEGVNPLTSFFGPPSKIDFAPQTRLPHET